MKNLFLWFVLFLSLNAHAVTTHFEGLDLLSNKEASFELAPNQKAIVVVFLSNVCPCSNSHVTEIKSLAEKHKDFTFVGMHSNSDEDSTTAANYFQKMVLPFPVIQDKKSTYANQFKASKTPHAFIINREGKILYRGGVSNSSDAKSADKMYLRDAIEDMSNGKTIRTAETRTLGCAISREVSSSGK